MREKRLRLLLSASRPLVEEALGEAAGAALGEGAWRRFNALEPDAPRFRQKINEGLFELGVPLLAVYQALREDLSMEQAPAVELLERALGAMYKPFLESRWRRAFLNLMFGVKPVRDIGLRMAYRADEPQGFRFEEVDEPGAVFGFDVRECALVKYLKAQGSPEIVPMICRLDDLMAAQLRGLSLRRQGTIGMGAERCDFRYVQIRRKPQR
jgi:hypothetical protein